MSPIYCNTILGCLNARDFIQNGIHREGGSNFPLGPSLISHASGSRHPVNLSVVVETKKTTETDSLDGQSGWRPPVDEHSMLRRDTRYMWSSYRLLAKANRGMRRLRREDWQALQILIMSCPLSVAMVSSPSRDNMMRDDELIGDVHHSFRRTGFYSATTSNSELM
ncbi:hypothetical protein AZE42_13148 [Rhizopogon vesiculosus]|uniref:Uncharacterized protein n=1 Tax=Rhizopogon vesiculosus TaxID=180088 RepID=A0A1J8PKS6_9AGAM|nr:hypothetical protein AZE42_13148 [Rhizopogon vesiculosus]